MRRYKSKTPRVAIGMAAVVMTALTFGLSVVVPAQVAAGTPEIARLATAAPVTAAPTEVTITPARIDVVADRAQPTTVGVVRQPLAKKGQPS